MSEFSMCEKHGRFVPKVHELMGLRFKLGCQQCVREQEEVEAAKKARETAEAERRAWEIRLGTSGIPERFRDRTLESYVDETAGQRRALAFAKAYAEGFDEVRRTGRSALFLGGPGTGKTHLSIGIAQHVMRAGRTALFLTVQRALRQIKDSWGRKGGVSETAAIKELVFPDLLILDEIGVQFGSETEKVLLFDLLNERYERRRPTIMLSNLTLDEVKAFLGERVFDRLREDGGEVVPFAWESHRGG